MPKDLFGLISVLTDILTMMFEAFEKKKKIINQQTTKILQITQNANKGFIVFAFYVSGFSIEGPSQAKIDCKDNGDGSADVTYWPTAPGEYAVHIMCEEEDIPQAPYMAQIQPATTEFDASKVFIYHHHHHHHHHHHLVQN